MANTRTEYVGDGVTKTFAITFPYLVLSHIEVFINNVQVVGPLYWSSPSPGSVVFVNAPSNGALIKIKRNTNINTRLVDYNDGAILTEDELDLDSKQAFYLAQEIAENYSDLVDNAVVTLATANGIVVSDPQAVIDQLVQDMLSEAAAIELQARITDIDTNAQSLLSQLVLINDEIGDRALGDDNLQTQINALVEATAASVYVQATAPVPGVGGIPNPIPSGARWYDSDDNNHPYIWDDIGLVWLDLEDPRIGANQAAITALDVRMVAAEGSIVTNASAISTLDTTVTSLNGVVAANSASITTLQTDLGTTDGNVAANASAASALTTRVTAAEGNIIATASDVTALTGRVTTAEGDISADGIAISALGVRTTATEAGISTNSSDITVLSSRVTTTEGDITSANVTILANTNAIVSNDGQITALEARYGVSLNVGGYVTGFEQFNNGSSGTFQIMADSFYIVDPASGGQNPIIPFAVSGGVVAMQNVVISGNLISSGTIEAVTFQTAATGQHRIVISDTNNEIQVYGDDGSGSIRELAKLGLIERTVADPYVLDMALDGLNSSASGINVQVNTGKGINVYSANWIAGRFESPKSTALYVKGGDIDVATLDVIGGGDARNIIRALVPDTWNQGAGLEVKVVNGTGGYADRVHFRLNPHPDIAAAPAASIGFDGDMTLSGNGHLYLKRLGAWIQVS